MEHDRRQYERAPLDSELEMRPEGETHWVRVHTRDVSLGGLSFYSVLELVVGAKIRVGMRVAEGGAFSLAATVVHVKREGDGFVVGVQWPRELSEAEVVMMRAHEAAQLEGDAS